MCGRYLVEIEESEILEIIKAAEKNSQNSSAVSQFSGGEIFPTNTAPVIVAGDKAQFMKWGFRGKHSDKRPYINARSETAATAPTFSAAMSERRCLVPASSYYEWKTIDKKQKEKYEFTLPDGTPLYMAGIYSDDGEYAILTREASYDIADIHNRMPVIIPKSLSDVWLNESADVFGEAITELNFIVIPKEEEPPLQMSLF